RTGLCAWCCARRKITSTASSAHPQHQDSRQVHVRRGRTIMSEQTPMACPLCKCRTPLIVLGPTLLAVLAGLGIWAFANAREESQEQHENSGGANPGAPVERVTLLVAKKDLDIHSALWRKPEEFLAEKSFDKQDAPKD